MATKDESALRRKARRRGVDLVRSRIKDAGVVSFGKWSIVEAGSGDVFAGLREGQPVWLDATPGNCFRTAWLAADEVDQILDEVFSANRPRGAPIMSVTLPAPAIVAAARAAADRTKKVSVALSAGYSVKRSPVMVEAVERPPNGNGEVCGRREAGEPGAGAASSTLDAAAIADLRLQADIAGQEQAAALDEIASLKAALLEREAATERPALAVPQNVKGLTKGQLQETCAFLVQEARAAKDELAERKFGGRPAELNAGDLCEALDGLASADVVDALQERFGVDLLKRWVHLAASEIEGAGQALVGEAFDVDAEHVTGWLDQVWAAGDWADACAERKGEVPPDPQADACHSLCEELLPMVDDMRFAPERASLDVVGWLRGIAHDPRWGEV